MRVGTCLLIVLPLVACTPGDIAAPRTSIVTFEGSSAVLQVEIADDDESRQRGLMGRELLPPGHGMAFVWDEPTTRTFWMKDVSIPLSIAFVDASGRIMTVRDMDPCTSEPCPKYGADAPYVMAIETNRGWFAEHRIGVGRTAKLEVNDD